MADEVRKRKKAAADEQSAEEKGRDEAQALLIRNIGHCVGDFVDAAQELGVSQEGTFNRGWVVSLGLELGDNYLYWVRILVRPDRSWDFVDGKRKAVAPPRPYQWLRWNEGQVRDAFIAWLNGRSQ